ncbi:50S ribosomal protein L4 [Dehalococcoidia bacterium]|nr:50S ribosomal protein L4 [Dehalococcoidia bacterium]
MNIRVKNTRGKIVKTVSLSDDVFGSPMNQALVHQVVVGQLANARQGTAHTKTRAQVAGGGAKPRPQKGTGGARVGSIRSPLWRGGGVIFGPKPRSYRHKTTKRARRTALVSVLSDKIRENKLVIVEGFDLGQDKTKEMAKVIHSLIPKGNILLVADGTDEKVLRAARNIPEVRMLPAALLNALDVLNAGGIIMTLESAKRAEELWGNTGGDLNASSTMANGVTPI